KLYRAGLLCAGEYLGGWTNMILQAYIIKEGPQNQESGFGESQEDMEEDICDEIPIAEIEQKIISDSQLSEAELYHTEEDGEQEWEKTLSKKGKKKIEGTFQ
ncbi:hypothetical protein ACJX0J_013521, partial [Zea mays]